jgi:arabinose-5-phosphate isomerase
VKNHPKVDFIKSGKEVIKIELEAIKNLLAKLDGNFNEACEVILNCKGRLVVIGMGKSGHIGRKIAATLASTGTPSFFVHPGEASHGDLGMITKQDVVLSISNSGATKEIIEILPIIKRLGAPLITITGLADSALAKESDINIGLNITREACPFNLAPTASTTAALVIGDALAIALLKARNFTKEDFAFSHPGGRLGKQLLLHTKDIMRIGDAIPQIIENTLLSNALIEMSRKNLGMTAITNKAGKMIGLFTDGDLRRTLDKGYDVHKILINEVMTTKFTTIKPDTLAIEALHLMETKKINGFFVLDNKQKIIGAFNMHDLLSSGVV